MIVMIADTVHVLFPITTRYIVVIITSKSSGSSAELSTSLPCVVVCGNAVGGDGTATSSSVDNKMDAVATEDVM